MTRLQSSAARAVAAASGTRGLGRRTGRRSRKNGSESVTASWPPPVMTRTPSPRSGTRGRSSIASPPAVRRGMLSRRARASPASPGPGRPVTQTAPPAALDGSEGRVGEHLAGGGSVPVAAGLEDRAAGELGRRVAEDGPVRDLARRRPAGAERERSPVDPRAATASRLGVWAASFAVRPPWAGCARSPRPSRSRTRSERMAGGEVVDEPRPPRAAPGGASRPRPGWPRGPAPPRPPCPRAPRGPRSDSPGPAGGRAWSSPRGRRRAGSGPRPGGRSRPRGRAR